MRFSINNANWKIVEVDHNTLKEEYLQDNPNENIENIYIYGRTVYTKQVILINKEVCEESRIKTLKHELCHCWMYNTANANQENYNEEHICEIVASSNDFVHEITEKYKKEMLKMACGGKKKGGKGRGK